MIIAEQTSAAVDTNIVATPSRFKIKASARAFKILSGFYSDPVLAIPRELGANAWDSHVSAENTDRMFEVHAPNTLEPWFSIRDFGIGLSAEAVDQIYTTYFESTKTNDNESDGCMGLGSKTPFNYTENFTVTSWFNGLKHVYNCFIDQSGAPNILQMGKEMSTEHNGVEIKFGVKPADISMFVEKIRQAYAPFRFRPIIKGAKIEYPETKTLYQGTGWALRDKGDRYNHESRAFMGNYSYPINTNSLFSGRATYGDKEYTKVSQLLNNGSVDLYFDIGDLEVAPNKEQLQYDADQRTQKAIIKSAIAAYDDLKKQVEASVEVPKTMWEAMFLHWKYNSYSSSFYTLRNIIGEIAVTFNKEKVTASEIRLYDLNEKLKLYKASPNANRYYDNGDLADGSKFTLKNLRYNIGSDQFKFGHGSCYTAQVDAPIIFFTGEDNVKKSRIREFLKKKFSGLSKIPETFFVQDTSVNFATIKAHQKYLGLPDSCLIHIEGLPKPARTPRVAKATASSNEVWYADSSHILDGRSQIYWSKQAANFTSTETYYYIVFLWNDPAYKGANLSYSNALAVAHEVYTKGLVDKKQTLWGINKRNRHLLKVGTWVNIVDLAKKQVEKNKKDYEQLMFLNDSHNKLTAFGELRNKLVQGGFISQLTKAKTRKAFEDFLSLFKLTTVDNNKLKLCEMFNIKAVKHEELPIEIEDVRKMFKETYMGIFDLVEYYSFSRNNGGNQLATIINFIDKNS